MTVAEKLPSAFGLPSAITIAPTAMSEREAVVLPATWKIVVELTSIVSDALARVLTTIVAGVIGFGASGFATMTAMDVCSSCALCAVALRHGRCGPNASFPQCPHHVGFTPDICRTLAARRTAEKFKPGPTNTPFRLPPRSGPARPPRRCAHVRGHRRGLHAVVRT